MKLPVTKGQPLAAGDWYCGSLSSPKPILFWLVFPDEVHAVYYENQKQLSTSPGPFFHGSEIKPAKAR